MAQRSAAGRLFGTDGIRGSFGEPPLDRATILRLAEALGRRLRRQDGNDATVVIAGDTRASTPEIGAWLASGLGRHGVRVRYGGVLPTPAVALLCRKLRAAAGIAISASHNPHPDNGVKLFDSSGFKWSEEAERELERDIAEAPSPATESAGDLPGTDLELVDVYLESLAAALPERDALAGLTIALDAANGAAAPWAEAVFRRHGAAVHISGNSPDGRNINLGCGSTLPQSVARLTTATGSDLGIAFDGDADRAILVDETGHVRDGDNILFVWARSLLERGELAPPRIVATVMSNIGLEMSLAQDGIEVVRCDVGDRVVVSTMQAQSIRLGGEQSGHIVDLERSTTGDGLLTALVLAGFVARSGQTLSTLTSGLEICPQILINVPVRERRPFAELRGVPQAEAEIVRRLGREGRLLLRYSGTEPLARIMLEGRDPAEIERMGEGLAELIEREIGAVS